GAEGFRLMVAPADSTDRTAWDEVVPARSDVRLVDVDAFGSHLVLSERAAGLEQLRVLPLDDGVVRVAEGHLIEMPEDVFSVWVGPNPEFDTPALRYGYTSLVAPVTDVDYEIATRGRRVVKVQPVDGYDAERFESHRVWATAPDGVRVPISVVH